MDSLTELRDTIKRSLPSGRAHAAHELDAGVEALLNLAGVDDDALALAERRLARRLDRVGRLGVTSGDLGVIGQAYTRAVGRIVDAEAEVILAIVRDTPARERLARLEALIRDAQSLRRRTFEFLHGALLRDALLERLPQMALDEPEAQPAAIAHVDIVDSTGWLTRASHSDTERLVDGLFVAAQSAVRDRSVAATKYVGDGVFLAGREPAEVADAALACIELLAEDPGLPARAGLAYGPVVRRAGDYFGLTVHLSHALTKVAPIGGLLACEPAAARLPGAMLDSPSTIALPGFEDPIATVVVVRA